MLDIDPKKLIRELLQGTPTNLWEIMKELETYKLIAPLTFIAGEIKFYECARKSLNQEGFSAVKVPEERVQTLFTSMGAIRETSENLNMRASKANIQKTFDTLSVLMTNGLVNGIDRDGLNVLISQLSTLLTFAVEELATYKFISILPENAEIFSEPLSKFDDQIMESFPGVTFELEEAGKSFALNRYTACIFHLMRAMEYGVGKLARELNATVVNKNGETLAWGILTANIKSEVEKLNGGPEKDSWLEVHSMLYSVNRAFRTKTAHPEKIYTQEQALSAISAVNGFLSHMAELTRAEILQFDQTPA